MTDRIEIDPEGLANAADVTEILEDGVRGVGARLRGKLEALETADGLPWGDDKMGDQFVANYKPARDNLLGGMDGIAEMLGQFVTAMRDAVTELEVTDVNASYGFGGYETPVAPNVIPGRPPRQPQPPAEEGE
ncbi:hypothetical protein ACWEKT_11760 [Nocardia takedensis]|uniref:hypothetical protein n=1 Tax=Nocardia takedensis TaxID=259390 RepID=UPI00031A477F|nr:hypothetical protein [Nocardia takedensis]